MPKDFEFKLSVIYEHEVRATAKLLEQLHDATEEEFPKIAQDALNACIAALYGISDDKNIVLLCSDTLKRRIGLKK